MNSEEYRDQLVDMLLWESVGQETPPDVRDQVLVAVSALPPESRVEEKPSVMPPPSLLPRSVDAPVRPGTGTVRRKRSSSTARLRPAKPSKLPALAAAAAVALLAGAGVFMYLNQISTARTPMLTWESETGDRSAWLLPAGKRLSTSSDSGSVLVYPDGTAVELSTDTTIILMERSLWDRSKGIEIVAGEVKAEVAPQPDGNPMVLSSKDAMAEIVGTKLTMQIDGDRTRLEVEEGSVRFIPQAGGEAVLVKTGLFAEAGNSGVKTGEINPPPAMGITGFTLMNAETDQPIRGNVLVDGETISLASLSTQEINLRADFEAVPPVSVSLHITRLDGGSTGLPAYVAKPQKHPPFFVAGDHWADGRPEDCRAWTPPPGRYHISATAVYEKDGNENDAKKLELEFEITE